MLAKSTSTAGISKSLRHEVSKLGTGSIVTPAGYLAFVFIFFVLAVSLFVCAQIGAARHEEADERLETLLSLPVSRSRWLAGSVLLAVAGAAAISLIAGLLTWAGAESGGVSISLAGMLEAGANCLPVAVLFLGIAALAYAIVPRASTGLSYGLVTVAFLWDLFGSLLSVPHWLVQADPVRARRARTRAAVSPRRGARHAWDCSEQRARGDVGLQAARPDGTMRMHSCYRR